MLKSNARSYINFDGIESHLSFTGDVAAYFNLNFSSSSELSHQKCTSVARVDGDSGTGRVTLQEQTCEITPAPKPKEFTCKTPSPTGCRD